MSGSGRSFALTARWIASFILFIAISIAVAILLLSNGSPRARLFVESSFIGSGYYAVVEGSDQGSSLYFGSLDGSPPISIDSYGVLAEPYILSKSQFLVVERIGNDVQRFRILDFNVIMNEINCRVLVESIDSLGYPFVQRKADASELLFYSGEFNPRASGPSVFEHHITVLRGEKYVAIARPAFLAIDRLAQVSSDRFLARSFGFSFLNGVNGGAGPETDLVDIKIMDDELKVQPFEIKNFSARSAASIATSVDGETAIVVWSESRSSRDMFATAVSLLDGRQMDTISLPTEQRLSGIFPDVNAGGRLTGWMLSANRLVRHGSALVTLTRFVEGETIKEGTIALQARRRLSADSCY